MRQVHPGAPTSCQGWLAGEPGARFLNSSWMLPLRLEFCLDQEDLYFAVVGRSVFFLASDVEIYHIEMGWKVFEHAKNDGSRRSKPRTCDIS